MVLLPMFSYAEQTHFSASIHEADWIFEGNRVQCHLIQRIPGFGEARFTQYAGGHSEFSLMKWTALKQPTKGQWTAEPAAWQINQKVEVVAQVHLKKGRQLTIFKTARSNQLLDALHRGLSPTLRYQLAGSELKSVSVKISNVHFGVRYQAYLDCTEKLLPYPAEEVRRTMVFFAKEGHFLTARAKLHLEQLALYLKQGLLYDRIVITGHTSHVGRKGYNRMMGIARAQIVKKYLVELGIPAQKMRLKNGSWKQPEFDNATQEGRSKNRRTVIEIDRY